MDVAILNFIQEHMRNSFFDWLMPIVSEVSDNGYWLILLAIILLFFRKYRIISFYSGAGYIIAYFFVKILKPLIARPRPCITFPDMYPALVGVCPSGWSFPSGHVTMAFLGVTMLFKLNKKLGWIGICLAILVAFSRMYLYDHYLTDVLGGAVVGMLAGIIGIWIVNFIYNKLPSGKFKSMIPMVKTDRRYY